MASFNLDPLRNKLQPEGAVLPPEAHAGLGIDLSSVDGVDSMLNVIKNHAGTNEKKQDEIAEAILADKRQAYADSLAQAGKGVVRHGVPKEENPAAKMYVHALDAAGILAAKRLGDKGATVDDIKKAGVASILGKKSDVTDPSKGAEDSEMSKLQQAIIEQQRVRTGQARWVKDPATGEYELQDTSGKIRHAINRVAEKWERWSREGWKGFLKKTAATVVGGLAIGAASLSVMGGLGAGAAVATGVAMAVKRGTSLLLTQRGKNVAGSEGAAQRRQQDVIGAVDGKLDRKGNRDDKATARAAKRYGVNATTTELQGADLVRIANKGIEREKRKNQGRVVVAIAATALAGTLGHEAVEAITHGVEGLFSGSGNHDALLPTDDNGPSQTIDPNQLGHYTPDQLNAFSTDQINSLSAQQISELTPTQVNGLNPDHISALASRIHTLVAQTNNDPSALSTLNNQIGTIAAHIDAHDIHDLASTLPAADQPTINTLGDLVDGSHDASQTDLMDQSVHNGATELANGTNPHTNVPGSGVNPGVAPANVISLDPNSADTIYGVFEKAGVSDHDLANAIQAGVKDGALQQHWHGDTYTLTVNGSSDQSKIVDAIINYMPKGHYIDNITQHTSGSSLTDANANTYGGVAAYNAQGAGATTAAETTTNHVTTADIQKLNDELQVKPSDNTPEDIFNRLPDNIQAGLKQEAQQLATNYPHEFNINPQTGQYYVSLTANGDPTKVTDPTQWTNGLVPVMNYLLNPQHLMTLPKEVREQFGLAA